MESSNLNKNKSLGGLVPRVYKKRPHYIFFPCVEFCNSNKLGSYR